MTTTLITGANKGLGKETARQLAAAGHTVYVGARDEARGRAAADELGARFVQLDVTDDASVAAAFAQIEADGGLDILINNAGIMLLGPALDSPTEEWDRMIALNVQASLYVTHAALPHLVSAAGDSARNVADLIYISSTAGRVARPGGGVYSLTKFGIAAFAESLRQELIAKRVRVGVVEPGTVHTELVTHLREDIRQAAEGQVDSIEALEPEDIADAVAYIVTRPRRVAVNQLLVRAGEQTW